MLPSGGVPYPLGHPLRRMIRAEAIIIRLLQALTIQVAHVARRVLRYLRWLPTPVNYVLLCHFLLFL